MDNSELSIKEEIKSDIYLLRLSGNLTKESGDFLLQWRDWKAGLQGDLKFLLIDFTGIKYMNSAGIAALIRLLRFGDAGNFRSGCFNLHYHYEKLFGMVGLNKYIAIYPSEWAAIEQMKTI